MVHVQSMPLLCASEYVHHTRMYQCPMDSTFSLISVTCTLALRGPRRRNCSTGSGMRRSSPSTPRCMRLRVSCMCFHRDGRVWVCVFTYRPVEVLGRKGSGMCIQLE